MLIKLGELSEIKNGYSFRKKVVAQAGGNVKVLQIKNILECGIIDFSTAVPVSLNNSKRHILKNEDVVITSRGKTLAALFLEPHDGNYIITSSLFRIRVKDPRILPAYLALYLNSDHGQQALMLRQSGNTTPSITIAALSEIPIPIISLQQQQKLVDLMLAYAKWSTQMAEYITLSKSIVTNIVNKALKKGHGKGGGGCRK